jgi:hypothetical protein
MKIEELYLEYFNLIIKHKLFIGAEFYYLTDNTTLYTISGYSWNKNRDELQIVFIENEQEYVTYITDFIMDCTII